MTNIFRCQFEGTISFRMRGLCRRSLFDFSYTLIRDGTVGEFYWRGLTGKSSIAWNKFLSTWMISPLDKSINTSALYRGDKAYPLGHYDWEIINDNCEGEQEEEHSSRQV